MVKFWNSCISEWEGRLTLHKGCGSRSFMTMTVTIWWLRSGVWIYQIVTAVTSVVGVPSTHLVSFPLFVYCSRDEVYLPKISCLFAADGGTLHGQHTTVAIHHIHDVTKPLMTFMLHYDVTWSVVSWRFKRDFGNRRKQPIYKFNWIEISVEIRLIKTANRMTKIIILCLQIVSNKNLYSDQISQD